jgi:hypothetical protein
MSFNKTMLRGLATLPLLTAIRFAQPHIERLIESDFGTMKDASLVMAYTLRGNPKGSGSNGA